MRESVTKGKKIWKESGFSSNRFGGSLLEGWYIYIEKREIGVDGKFGRRFLGLKKRCSSREPSNRERRSCRYVSRYSPCHRLISISPHPWLFLNIHFCCLMWTSMATWLFCWIRVLFIHLFIYFFFTCFVLILQLLLSIEEWHILELDVFEIKPLFSARHLFSSPLTK